MKGIITIIIIIAIVVVGFLLLRDGATENASVTTEKTTIDTTAEIIVVTYIDGKFLPKEIVVSQGQTVRFVNESSGNMWVASDIHPAHKILPEFDDKKSIGAGENYEFTFTEAGKWKYHNHVNPSKGGTVTVE